MSTVTEDSTAVFTDEMWGEGLVCWSMAPQLLLRSCHDNTAPQVPDPVE